MTGVPHDHSERVEGCFRCELSAEEDAVTTGQPSGDPPTSDPVVTAGLNTADSAFTQQWAKLVSAINEITALPLDDMARWVDLVERQTPPEAATAMAPVGRTIAASQHFKAQITSRDGRRQ